MSVEGDDIVQNTVRVSEINATNIFPVVESYNLDKTVMTISTFTMAIHTVDYNASVILFEFDPFPLCS